MYWLGLREGDVHQNISSPGWAKHAWSGFFAPWSAGATVLMHHRRASNSQRQLELLRARRVGSLSAPHRLADAGARGPGRAARGAARAGLGGPPLNPEVMEAGALGVGAGLPRRLHNRDHLRGRRSPRAASEARLDGAGVAGYDVLLLDHDGREASEGEIALRLAPRPVSLMAGYIDNPERTAAATAGGYYRTGDEAQRDADGYFH